MIWGDRRVIRIDMGWYGVIWGDGIPPPTHGCPPPGTCGTAMALGGDGGEGCGVLQEVMGQYGVMWGDIG